MCPTVHPSVHTSSLANVCCNESLVCFAISGFYAIINIGSYTWLSYCCPVSWRSWSFEIAQISTFCRWYRFWDGPINLEPWIWVRVAAELVSLTVLHTTRAGSLPLLSGYRSPMPPSHWQKTVTSPVLMPSRPTHWHLCLQSQLHCVAKSRCGAYSSKHCSPQGSGPSFLLSYLWDLLTHAFTIRASSTALPRPGAGPALPGATASRGGRTVLLFSWPQSQP